MIKRKVLREGLQFPKEIPFKVVSSRSLAEKLDRDRSSDFPMTNVQEMSVKLNMDQICQAYHDKERIVLQY